MADLTPLAALNLTPTTAKAVRPQSGDNLVGFGTLKGRDPAVDGPAQDAHIAAAAPHTGHATTGALATVATAAATAATAASAAQSSADAAQADVDAHEAAAAPHTGHATTGALSTEVTNRTNADTTLQMNITAEVARAMAEEANLASLIGAAGGGNVVGTGTSVVGTVAVTNNTTTSALVPTPVTVNPSTGDIAGARDIAARNLNPTGTVKGRDPAVDGPAQDAHIAAAAPHSGHATTGALSTEVTNRGNADTALQSNITALAAVVTAVDAAAEHVANKNAASGYPGLGSDGYIDPPHIALARSRNIAVARGRITYVPPLLRARAPILRASNHWYGDESTGSRTSSGHRAGSVAIAPNNAGVSGGPIHPDAGSFPFVNVDCSMDFNGYPNYHGKRFHSSNAQAESGKDGYEVGRRIPAAYLLRNQGQRRKLKFKIKNALADNVFFELAVEPNHRRGVFSAASRARLIAGPFNMQWTGWYDLEAMVDFHYLGGTRWCASASFSLRALIAEQGLEVWSDTVSADIVSGFNFQTTVCEFLTYAFQVNTFNLVNTYGTYTAQGTGSLEAVLVSSETEPLVACR